MAKQGAPTAPPVVGVVVTHDPGDWFDVALSALAAQDYPNLTVLVLDTGSVFDPTERVHRVLPEAVVRRLDAATPYGAAANEVLRLVEGGAFYLFLHDDVALDPDAVRLLVEEAYRSNAGVAGPKMADWNDPTRLLQVGLSTDKFGVIAPLAERGERDQEQHDAVRDVFTLPGGALLIRADLFRALGGFDVGIDFHGDDLDLCWRAQVAGGRVLVVPAARARHAEALGERRATDDRRRLQTRHRLRTLLSCASPLTLARVLPQLAVVNLVEIVVAVVTGRVAQARDIVSAWLWNLRRRSAIAAKRRTLAALRQVPDSELRPLQVRGSARLNTFVRGQIHRSELANPLQSAAAASRELVSSLRTSTAVWGTWLIAIALFIVGSRRLITDGVPVFGELVSFGSSPTALVRTYLSGWRDAGLGRAGPAPTSMGLVSLAGFVSFAHLQLVRTLLVIVPILLGWIGMWRLTRPYGVTPARLVGVIVYAAIPVAFNAVANGSHQALVAYGAMPFVLARLARFSRLAPFESTRRSFLAQSVSLGLVIALVGAFSPIFAATVLVTALAIAFGSLFAGGVAGSLRAVGGALSAIAVAFVLHVPWSIDLATHPSWDALVAVPRAGPTRRSLAELLRFDTGPTATTLLGFAFLIVSALALVVGRQWRWAWAVRAWFIALTFFSLAWFAERHSFDVGYPAAEVLLVPAAVALALAAATGVAAFNLDVRGSRFSWRQVVSLGAGALIVIGIIGGLGAVSSGRWRAPASGLARTTSFLREAEASGPYRILWIGDARALPVGGWRLDDGLGFGLSSNADVTLDDRWPGPPTRGTEKIEAAIDVLADHETSRFGRMLAPMAIRYVIVPNRLAPSFERGPRYDAPAALTDALAGQLDLRRIDADEAVTVYENQAWMPARALLTGASAGAASQEGFGSLITTDLTGNKVALQATSQPYRYVGTTGPGDLFLAESSSDDWTLHLDGTEVVRRPAFGWANVFTLERVGRVTLAYDTPVTHQLAVGVQVALWVIAIVVVRRAARRRRRAEQTVEHYGAPEPIVVPIPSSTDDETPVLVGAMTTPGASAAANGAGTGAGARYPTGLEADDLPWLTVDDDDLDEDASVSDTSSAQREDRS